ncbi:N-acetylmuramoyl-L-alanine amidase [Streptomyces sp. NBC_00829]|uniref:peptidoglycan recognition protein family protein n=1 Tax=Streptomyces sp. NBC_00829 TaxID=2903679 RepID=UPI00386B9B40|nr:N-acetylmuramoyl-L-alanine amidase [Streptomyces sp. NBC_00829]
MASPMSADRLLKALRAEGLAVVEVDEWRTNNRNAHGPWGPVHGVMIHHTVTSGTADTVSLCYHGHSSLPGPLCHGVIDKAGTVHLVGNGRANHAGLGDDDVLRAVIDERDLPPDNEANTDGNRAFYGFECINLGNGNDPWPAAQLEAIEKAAAAICRVHGWSRRSVIGHREWQPGKVDPRGFTMTSMRARIGDRLGTTPPPEEDDMTPEQARQLKELHEQRRVAPWTYKGELNRDAWAILNSAWSKLDAMHPAELTDAQITAIADRLAEHPTLAAKIAEQVAERLAAGPAE